MISENIEDNIIDTDIDTNNIPKLLRDTINFFLLSSLLYNTFQPRVYH